MKSFLTIYLIIAWTFGTTLAQSNADGLIGIYESADNGIERYSIMTLEVNNRFIYKYGIGGCQGEVKGNWKTTDKKLVFKNDLAFLNDPSIIYPDLSLTTWTVKTIGIRPESIVNSMCLKEDKIHYKKGVVASSSEYSVSLIRLIANPEKYHGKKIQVTGYINLEFEGDAIYLHKEDYDQALSKNGFWVNFSDKLDWKEIKKLNKNYVLIEGTFDMTRHGHMGLFGGEINDITRIIRWGN